MRHQKKAIQFSRPRKESDRLVRNLLANIILYEKVKTTPSKAKKLRGKLDKLINIGKKGDLASYRQLLSFFYIKEPAKKITEDLSVRYADKTSGFSRIILLGNRKGDGAKMAIWELVEGNKKSIEKAETENKKEKKSEVKIKIKKQK
ncbi:MAG: 50S ribosomal protein L17 [Patescibacteria group bacterium]|nr:50S ribosomal protein L17 [Patescibacteria group bacterium]